MAETKIFAVMEDFDFEGVSWRITSFSVSGKNKEGGDIDAPSNGNEFTQAQKDLIRAKAKGQKVTIADIKAECTNGKKASLSAIVFTLE